MFAFEVILKFNSFLCIELCKIDVKSSAPNQLSERCVDLLSLRFAANNRFRLTIPVQLRWVLFDCFIMRNGTPVYHFACYICLYPNLIILKIGPPGRSVEWVASGVGSDVWTMRLTIYTKELDYFEKKYSFYIVSLTVRILFYSKLHKYQ